MFKKEDARYARFLASSLNSIFYQGRMGILAAGDFGTPQVCGQVAGGMYVIFLAT
jgi:hypothetical protein